jgi:hypothetical protein
MNKILSDLYFDVKKPTAYAGAYKLYLAAKVEDASIKLKDVKKWLSSNETYSLHFPPRSKFKRRSVISYGIDWLWQAVSNPPSEARTRFFFLGSSGRVGTVAHQWWSTFHSRRR